MRHRKYPRTEGLQAYIYRSLATTAFVISITYAYHHDDVIMQMTSSIHDVICMRSSRELCMLLLNVTGIPSSR